MHARLKLDMKKRYKFAYCFSDGKILSIFATIFSTSLFANAFRIYAICFFQNKLAKSSRFYFLPSEECLTEFFVVVSRGWVDR